MARSVLRYGAARPRQRGVIRGEIRRMLCAPLRALRQQRVRVALLRAVYSTRCYAAFAFTLPRYVAACLLFAARRIVARQSAR